MATEVLFTQERWDGVLDINKQLMKQYLRSLKADKKRPRTVEQYMYDLSYNGMSYVYMF